MNQSPTRRVPLGVPTLIGIGGLIGMVGVGGQPWQIGVVALFAVVLVVADATRLRQR
nr:hypothetical protein [Pseudonocardia sp. AL041005-10]